jgi:hypothetical protein
MTLHKNHFSMSVIAASFLGPSLTPSEDVPWREENLPLDCDDLVQKVLGQPMRRAGRFIKLVCSGAAACLQKAPAGLLAGKKTGIFLATGLGNGDEILPFITQVFLHDGGFPPAEPVCQFREQRRRVFPGAAMRHQGGDSDPLGRGAVL